MPQSSIPSVHSGLIGIITGAAFRHLPPPHTAYFSNENSAVNFILVRQAWLWTTMVCFGMYHTGSRAVEGRGLLSRWLGATVWWILVTQWFLGPSLTDRTFRATGGEWREHVGFSIPTTRSQYRLSEGKWVGGHDISGHAFTLTHANALLYSISRSCRPAGWGRIAAIGLMGLWWWSLLMTGVYFHPLLEKVTAWIVATSV
ncbi:inositol phospholipid synthesis and fat-storage-inducing TM-domain-containing protein [Tuber brumale]|nr:inositol phospholipid synthesis and fat-storage-inducing TM-domain-containing protein [Tuber brumale]